MAETDTFFALQSVVAGRYSLVRELGRGGMGVVYLARDVALDRAVAIKLLPPSLADNAELRTRFLREARTVARLTHPNIVGIHAVEEHGTLVFFVMSYIEGQTLRDHVLRAGPLALRDAVRILRDVAWALAHAHARGIIHRDVKPDNVIIESESGRAIVTDFGIAAAAGVDTPHGGTVIGTPQYLSPEQARGEEAVPCSDLYSLGATAWFALTGAPPFEGSPAQLLHKHASQTLPPLASVRTDVPLSLGMIVDRCLAKHLSDRPGSAEVVADELGVPNELTASVPVPVRRYLKAVSGTEVQIYAAIGAVGAVAAAVFTIRANLRRIS